jgi:four helix bundle protein
MEEKKTTRNICERTFIFAVRIVKLCQVLETSSRVSRTMANQLLRSGTSVGANVEEAQGGQSKADFIAKLSISRKEARETLYWLRLLDATQVFPTAKLETLIDEANQLVAILTTIIKNAQTK